MTTGVHVDVILNCFFSCKDRASERYRPYLTRRQSTWICVVLFGVAPVRFVLFRCFSAGETEICREICGSSLLPSVLFLFVFR